MTLTQDASKGCVPEQRLLKKTLVNEGGVPYIYIYIHTPNLELQKSEPRSGFRVRPKHLKHKSPGSALMRLPGSALNLLQDVCLGFGGLGVLQAVRLGVGVGFASVHGEAYRA